MIVQAFANAISPLGENAARQMFVDLLRNGVFLGDPNLTLEKLSTGVYSLFNDDAAHLILERVVIELDSMYSSKTHNSSKVV
jgi:hypothetical protein